MELSSRKLGWVAGGLVLVLGAVLYWRLPMVKSVQNPGTASPAPSTILRNSQRVADTPAKQDVKAVYPPQITWKQVSSFRFDWDRYKDVQLTLESPASWNDAWGDPPISDFQRIRILIPGKKEYVLEGDWDGGLSEFKAWFPVHTVKNLLESNDIVALKAAHERTLLFIFGPAYASNPGSLQILELSDDGDPRIVFDQKNFELTDFRDLDGDGVAEVIGLPDFAQCSSETDCDKVPFDVYHLSSVAGGITEVSEPLSEKYNSEHH